MDGSWPHVTVAGLVLDPDHSKTIIIYRGENVRSAKNRWAILTGLLEHGESVDDALVREAEEELGLHGCTVLPGYDGFYENQSDGFHWVLVVRPVVHPSCFEGVRNMEPDKHDKIETIGLRALWTQIQYGQKTFDRHADTFLTEYLPRFFK